MCTPRIRPRDRLFDRGPDALSNEELLAAVLDRRGRPAQAVYARAAALLDDGLDGFGRREFASRSAVRELGTTDATRLAALVEFSRRLATQPVRPRLAMTAPHEVAAYLEQKARDWTEERVGVLLVDSRHRLVADREVVRGSIDNASVTPADLLRRVLLEAVPAFVLYHNHPSGIPEPSRDDLVLTRGVAEASRTLGVRLMDHIIVGRGSSVSLAARGLLEPKVSVQLRSS